MQLEAQSYDNKELKKNFVKESTIMVQRRNYEKILLKTIQTVKGCLLPCQPLSSQDELRKKILSRVCLGDMEMVCYILSKIQDLVLRRHALFEDTTLTPDDLKVSTPSNVPCLNKNTMDYLSSMVVVQYTFQVSVPSGFHDSNLPKLNLTLGKTYITLFQFLFTKCCTSQST